MSQIGVVSIVRIQIARTSACYVTWHLVTVQLVSLLVMTSRSRVAQRRSSRCSLMCTAYFRSTLAHAPNIYNVRVSVSIKSANLFRRQSDARMTKKMLCLTAIKRTCY